MYREFFFGDAAEVLLGEEGPSMAPPEGLPLIALMWVLMIPSPLSSIMCPSRITRAGSTLLMSSHMSCSSWYFDIRMKSMAGRGLIELVGDAGAFEEVFLSGVDTTASLLLFLLLLLSLLVLVVLVVMARLRFPIDLTLSDTLRSIDHIALYSHSHKDT